MMFRERQARQGCLSVCALSFAWMQNHTSTHIPSPYKYFYNLSQPHINCRHRTCHMNALPVSQNVANRQHHYLFNERSVVSHYPSPRTNPSKSALSFEKHYHPCLPCQREVDWRQGTNCCFVAFCLRYAHSFYIVNFSAVKTEGLLYTTDPSKTALSLEKGEVLLLGQAEPTTVGIVVA